MTREIARRGRPSFVLLAVLTIILAGCSSGSKSTLPNGATNAPGATNAAGASANGGDTGGLTDAASKLSDIKSYKFSMTLAGGTFGSMLSAFGAAASGNGGTTISGTIVSSPDKAADVTMAGMHIIEAGGKQYIDLGTGTFYATPMTGSSIADSFAPSTMFSASMGSSSSYTKVGTGQKNGVSADHFQGTDAAFSGLDSLAGVSGATWTADLWLATSGGYPVSMAIIGTKDGTVVYQVSFDITNINDPTNKVTAPAV
jgi:hypothetical protein